MPLRRLSPVRCSFIRSLAGRSLFLLKTDAATPSSAGQFEAVARQTKVQLPTVFRRCVSPLSLRLVFAFADSFSHTHLSGSKSSSPEWMRSNVRRAGPWNPRTSSNRVSARPRSDLPLSLARARHRIQFSLGDTYIASAGERGTGSSIRMKNSAYCPRPSSPHLRWRVLTPVGLALQSCRHMSNGTTRRCLKRRPRQSCPSLTASPLTSRISS